MVAYVNVFWLMTVICIAAMPLLLLLQTRKKEPGEEPLHLAVE